MRSVGMLLAAPVLGLGVVACGSGTSRLETQTTTASPTAVSTATPSQLTVSLPSDPCQWLLDTDARALLGVAINTHFDGATNCSYSPGTLEETASPSPGAADGASLDILDSTSFASGEMALQPDGVSYSIAFVPAANVIPGSPATDTTFFAIGNGSLAHPVWTYLYVNVNGNVYFRVGILDPSATEAQRQAKDQAAALDVLRNLKLH